MKKLFICCFFTVAFVQPSIFKTKKIKQPTAQDIKIQLAQNLQDLHSQITATIRRLTESLDEIAVRGKELTGQKDGLLSGNDKEALKEYQKRVFLLQKSLIEIESNILLN